MGNHNGMNGSVNGNGSGKHAHRAGDPDGHESDASTTGGSTTGGSTTGGSTTGGSTTGGSSTTGSPTTGSIEYYILCPQRATEVPGLITHLISRDICEKRQSESYHKCPNCVRSRIWRERNGLPVEEPAASSS